jgi:hypothetical protein
MAIALILLSLLHAFGLAGAFLVGWGTSRGWFSAEAHLYVAITAASLALFAHSMVLFYFIGTGKTLKEIVARFGLEPEILRQIRWFKAQTSGPLTLACAAVITSSALGGRILIGQSSTPHFWAAALTVVLNTWAVGREVRSIALNVGLFNELGERLGQLEPDEAPVAALQR